jgi:hypothetical protein
MFGYESEVDPLRLSKHDGDKVVDSQLISDFSHYCLIENLSRLLSSKVSKSKETSHFCRRCLCGVHSEEKLKLHKEYRDQCDDVKLKLPLAGTMLKFKHHHRSMRVPFIVYADFESFIKPSDLCKHDPSESYTYKFQNTSMYLVCLHIKFLDDSVYELPPVLVTAESEDDDVAQKFV